MRICWCDLYLIFSWYRAYPRGNRYTVTITPLFYANRFTFVLSFATHLDCRTIVNFSPLICVQLITLIYFGSYLWLTFDLMLLWDCYWTIYLIRFTASLVLVRHYHIYLLYLLLELIDLVLFLTPVVHYPTDLHRLFLSLLLDIFLKYSNLLKGFSEVLLLCFSSSLLLVYCYIVFLW